jgi:integrase/recombinase XerD
MRRAGRPALSPFGQQVLDQYERQLRTVEDLTAATIRNYLSDLHHFAGWYESRRSLGREEALAFRPEAITTPTITDYRAYLQQTLRLKPNSVNRALISLKRYFAWLLSTGHLKYDPAKVVKLVGEEVLAPRHLDDQEEQALVAAVTEAGSLRDRAIVVLLLHTGLRARELCTLTRAHVRLGKRSGTIWVLGKGNKYREIPLNATARAALRSIAHETLGRSDAPLSVGEETHPAYGARIRLPGAEVCRTSTCAQCESPCASSPLRLPDGGIRPAPSTRATDGTRFAGHDDALCASDHA